ncbi:MAG: TIGR03619 family F420-dependent LLM class oxidoreductase [Sphingomonadaceae bacterium]|nr:TIGR03619 family F420-dependent LLM class oxidoreductase [Sphingomonadaceae bacterium]
MKAIPKIGINIVPVPIQLLTRFARLAEELGFESLWSGEHVCLPNSEDWWKLYPSVVAAGERGHSRLVPFTPHTQFLDPMVVLASIAAVTSRVRLGIGIYLLALREAVLVGRTIASLDQLSGGRLDLGVGLGWTPDEYSFTGNDWNKRGRKMDETILALRALFEQKSPEFHGEFYDFPPIGFEPKPVQKPLPIHVGGFGAAAERRAAKLGNGWYGAASHIPAVRELLAENGRADDPFTFGMIDPREMIARPELDNLAAQGVDRVVVTIWSDRDVARGGESQDAPLFALEQYAKRIGLA